MQIFKNLLIRSKHKYQHVIQLIRNSDYLQFILIITSVGIGLRVYQFSSLRSLWLDEAMLARNIIDRSMINLLIKPLDYNQGAPILFLFFEKLSTLILGKNDIALRIFPFICGVLILPFSIYIAGKTYGKVAGLISGILVASNYRLVYLASEVKQYSSDAFISLAVISYFLTIFDTKLKKQNYLQILLLGIFSSLLSHPNLFVFGGLAFVLWGKTYFLTRKTEHKSEFYKLTGVLFSWIAIYSILYLISLQNLSSNNHLLNYWANGFMPIPPWENIQWFGNLPVEFTYTLLNGYYQSQIPFIILICLGCLFLWKNQKNLLFGIIIIGFGLLAASALKLYPIKNRMVIFTIPLIIILISGGIQLIYNVLKEYRIIAWCVIGFICIFISYGSIQNISTYIQYPENRYTEHTKPLLEILKNQRKEDEALYVYYASTHAYQYYQTISEKSDYLVFYSENHRSDPQKYIDEINSLSEFSTIWILFSHVHGNEQSIILDYVEEIGTCLEEYHDVGASLWKYQLVGNE